MVTVYSILGAGWRLVYQQHLCCGWGGGEWGSRLRSAVDVGVRQSKMKTNKKELKHMWKQEMKGRMGVGVVCPVRPFVSTSCLLSKGLWFLTHTKRHYDAIFQIFSFTFALKNVPIGCLALIKSCGYYCYA